MAATLTRRALRRARLGGRHTYRTAARHRVPLLIAAAAVTVALATVGVAGEVGHDGPPRFGPASARPMDGQLPGPMGGSFTGPGDGPMAGRADGQFAGPPEGRPDGHGPGGPGRG